MPMDMYSNGNSYRVVEEINENIRKVRMELEEVKAELQIYKGLTQGSQDNSKVEYISTYIQLLFQSQSVGHDVHTEIDKALKQFRADAGIDG